MGRLSYRVTRRKESGSRKERNESEGGRKKMAGPNEFRALASRIAQRRLPGPESLALVTEKMFADTGQEAPG